MENKTSDTRKRVAAYCRVSTGSCAQQASLAAQIRYYTDYIHANPAWKLAEIFTDRGISGTAKRKRPEFLRMIYECEQQHVDMVITKSVSRFARNTLDCIETVRHLQNMNVAVYFEKENLNTLSMASELFLTVLGAVAQEESMSKSQNIKWRYQRDFARGVYNQSVMPYGYTSNGKYKFIPHPERAEVVLRIYSECLEGKSNSQIVQGLSADGIPAPAEAGYWSSEAVMRILKNERYAGDMLLQKYYSRSNDETFTRRRNRGEKTRYYVTDTHTMIIPREIFDRVQKLLAARGGKPL